MHVIQKKQWNTHGFTLVETLLVIALILILSVISIVGFQSFASQSNHTKATEIVLATIKEAHAKTLAAYEDTSYGVHFSSNEVVLFEGDTYSSGASTNVVTPLSARASITDISLSGGGADLVFERLSGETTTPGTITVTSNTDATKFRVITIHESGLCEITM